MVWLMIDCSPQSPVSLTLKQRLPKMLHFNDDDDDRLTLAFLMSLEMRIRTRIRISLMVNQFEYRTLFDLDLLCSFNNFYSSLPPRFYRAIRPIDCGPSSTGSTSLTISDTIPVLSMLKIRITRDG